MARLNLASLSPAGMQAMVGLETYLRQCGLEKQLLHLVKFRASQINGCAYCLDMHYRDLRAGGETEQRLACLPAWRECSFYSDRECAALAWTEAVTLVADTHVPDAVYDQARGQFSEKELADLTLAIATINAWNRLSISARTAPGEVKPSTVMHG
jgi:AhpD family alkylhydroperoxidase